MNLLSFIFALLLLINIDVIFGILLYLKIKKDKKVEFDEFDFWKLRDEK